MKKIKNYTGITLVSLIITIVVMLILAGVTISFTSDSGLITKADETVKANKLAEDKEVIEITWIKLYQTKSTISLNELVYEINKKLEVSEHWELEGSTIIKSSSGNRFTVTEDGKAVEYN